VRRPQESYVLRLVFTDDQRPARARDISNALADLGDDVSLAVIVDVLRRVEPQPVEMKLIDPVAGVGDEELAHRPAVLAVEVERGPPVGRVALADVVRRELREIIPIGTEMVINDIEDDADAKLVRAVHESAEVVRSAVQTSRRKQIHAVVAPSESARPVRDGHELDHRDAELRERRKLARRGDPRSFPRERADVHLVEHSAGQHRSTPRVIRPLKFLRVDHARRAMRPLGLES
jgi:hypothetical protein